MSELRGERVRTYRNETLAALATPNIDAFRLNSPGLPPDFLPLYAGTREDLFRKETRSLRTAEFRSEELIVPFIKIYIKRTTS